MSERSETFWSFVAKTARDAVVEYFRPLTNAYFSFRQLAAWARYTPTTFLDQKELLTAAFPEVTETREAYVELQRNILRLSEEVARLADRIKATDSEVALIKENLSWTDEGESEALAMQHWLDPARSAAHYRARIENPPFQSRAKEAALAAFIEYFRSEPPQGLDPERAERFIRTLIDTPPQHKAFGFPANPSMAFSKRVAILHYSPAWAPRHSTWSWRHRTVRQPAVSSLLLAQLIFYLLNTRSSSGSTESTRTFELKE